MKKIVIPTGYNRLETLADKDGLFLRGTVGDNYVAVGGPIIRATAAEGQEPECKEVENKDEYIGFADKLDKLGKRAFIICSVGAVLCFVLSIVCAFFEGWIYQVAFTLAYFMIAGCILHKGVGIFFAKLFGDEEVKEFTKYHAAKNAVENAFYATGKVPTLEEVKEYSTFNHQNQYVKNGYMATVFVAFSVLRFLPILLYVLSAILLVAFVTVWEKKSLMRFWQFLVTSKPDDSHYNVAIAGVEECADFFKHVHFEKNERSEPTTYEEFEFALALCEGCEVYDSCDKREERLKKFEVLKKEREAEEAKEADAAKNPEDAQTEEVVDETNSNKLSSSSNPTDTEGESEEESQ